MYAFYLLRETKLYFSREIKVIMKFSLTYIQPFFLICAVYVIKSQRIDDGLKELCDPNKEYRCDCPQLGDTKKTVDCSNRDLTNMSQFISFKNIEVVNFKNNKIKSILENTFAEGRDVIELDISHNNIDFIYHSVFQRFESLEKLILSHNSIWSLDLNLFDGLFVLKSLDLSFNRISSWDKSVFIPCKSLKELNLRYNSIGSMGLEFNAFQHLPQLETLNLENTGLNELPSDLFAENYKLKALYLNGNQFETVPNSALQSALSLSFLDMSSTNLEVIQYEDFFGLKSLTELRLERIHSLQRIGRNAFSDLENLQSFVCKHNYQLTQIDSKAFTNNITGEPLHLVNLILRHNSLQSLSEEMVLWKSLHLIDLEGNPWQCDCNMKWLAELDIKDRLMETKCYKPHRLSGHLIKSVSATDFVCQTILIGDSFLITILIFLMLTTLALICLAFLFIRNQCCKNGFYIPFKKEKLNYMKVVVNKDTVDLEWDDSAEP